MYHAYILYLYFNKKNGNFWKGKNIFKKQLKTKTSKKSCNVWKKKIYWKCLGSALQKIPGDWKNELDAIFIDRHSLTLQPVILDRNYSCSSVDVEKFD